MSRHEDIIRLRHMLDHAVEAVAMLGDKSLDELNELRMLKFALT